MNLINASYEILEPSGDLFKDIELAARTCYKSEDKITDDSAKKMVDMLIERKHTAMLEHGTIYLKLKWYQLFKIFKYYLNKYSVVKNWNNITTNYRVIIENKWEKDLKYNSISTDKHEKRLTVKFICDRGVSHEFVRHRVFSFAQESTRYCNYSKDKFGNQITYIIPSWFDQDTDNKERTKTSVNWYTACQDSEKNYNNLIKGGWSPQEARSVLPNSLKTELIMTGTISQWKGFFILRDAAAAHPQARELAEPLHKEFKKRKLV